MSKIWSEKVHLISLFAIFCLKAMRREEAENKQRITFLLSHTRIGTLACDGKKFTALPAFGLNCDYGITGKFAIGLPDDFIAETFVSEILDGEAEFERELHQAAMPSPSINLKMDYLRSEVGVFKLKKRIFAHAPCRTRERKVIRRSLESGTSPYIRF